MSDTGAIQGPHGHNSEATRAQFRGHTGAIQRPHERNSEATRAQFRGHTGAIQRICSAYEPVDAIQRPWGYS